MHSLIQFFTSDVFLGFILGIAPSAFVWLWKTIGKWWKIRKFTQMVKQTYLIPVQDAVNENYSLDKIKKKINYSIYHLSYLKSYELKYLNEHFQFELIRVTEYSKWLLKSINDAVNRYGFKDPGKKENILSDTQIAEVNSLIKMYDQNVKKYKSLTIDSL